MNIYTQPKGNETDECMGIYELPWVWRELVEECIEQIEIYAIVYLPQDTSGRGVATTCISKYGRTSFNTNRDMKRHQVYKEKL